MSWFFLVYKFPVAPPNKCSQKGIRLKLSMEMLDLCSYGNRFWAAC